MAKQNIEKNTAETVAEDAVIGIKIEEVGSDEIVENTDAETDKTETAVVENINPEKELYKNAKAHLELSGLEEVHESVDGFVFENKSAAIAYGKKFVTITKDGNVINN